MPDEPGAFELTRAAVEESAKRRRRPRQHVSPAEVALLSELLDRELRPKQQAPVGPYDLDFYFPIERLCVEVDGAAAHEHRHRSDERRDQYLAKRGIATLRLPARLVFWCPAECAVLIALALASLRSGHAFPTGKLGPVLGVLEELREKRIGQWQLRSAWRP
jgi:very-short-patch-repair endonuclease